MSPTTMGVFHSKLAHGLALAALVVACGARSRLECFGESCRPELGGASGEATGVDPGSDPGAGGRGPAAGAQGSVPPEPGGPPPPTVGPAEPPPVSSSAPRCAFDGRFDLSISIFTPNELASLEGCSEVEGDLIITGLFPDGLRELRALRRVGGNLELRVTGRLDGLENLEVVENLTLAELDVPTLAPLAALRQIGTGDNREGSLVINALSRVRDLNGLGGLQRLGNIEIDDAGSLASLTGLAVPAELNWLQVLNSPALVDLSALSTLEEATEVLISGTNLETLTGLENLRRVSRTFTLSASPALANLQSLATLQDVGALSLDTLGVQNLAGLEGLESARAIFIQNNPSLIEADALATLARLEQLSVNENPALLRLPELQNEELSYLYVANNALLEAGPSFPRATRIHTLFTANNPRLVSVRLEQLQIVDEVSIYNNSQLAALDLNQLVEARALEIACNSSLLESTLEPLRSLSADVRIYGNLGSSTPCETAQ